MCGRNIATLAMLGRNLLYQERVGTKIKIFITTVCIYLHILNKVIKFV